MEATGSPLVNPDLSGEFNTGKWDGLVKQCESQRIYLEQQWFTNIAFYRGNQWAIWMRNPLTDSGVALMKPKTQRKRLVFNKVKPTVRNEFTKLIKEEPQWFIRPNTTDQSDIEASKTGEAITEWLMESRHFNRARRRATWWAALTGTGFIKTSYNSEIKVGGGGTLAKTSYDGEGQEVTEEEQYENPNGTVEWVPVSPFHIFVPHLDREDIEDQPWIVHARTYDPQVVRDMYGVDDLQPDTSTSGLGFETRFLQAINVRNTTNRFDQVYVKELWHKPCREYPEGALIVWANGKILFADEHPYEHKEFPFAKISHIPSGGFYAYSTVEDLIPLQKEYNLFKSQVAEARDMTSKPAIVVDKGSVDTRKIKAVPGQIIEVQPGAERPQRLINPDLPQYTFQDSESTRTDWDDISGQYEVTQGRTPPGVEAASAIAYLQEENNTRLYHTVASIEEAVRSCGRQALMLIQQYWEETRIINTVSSTHMEGVIEFKGSDLKDNTDLRVVAGSMAPRSDAAKQASIMELLQMQLIPPEVGLKNLGQPETQLIYDEMFIDVNHARRENLRMARGTPVDVNDFDNHEVHVEVHNNYRKSAEYEMLSEEMKGIFNTHVEEHQKVFLTEEMVITDGDDEPDEYGEFGTESGDGSNMGGLESAPDESISEPLPEPGQG